MNRSSSSIRAIRILLLTLPAIGIALTSVSCGGGGSSPTSSNPQPAPAITSFTPQTGSVGTSVVVIGTNFTGTTALNFNGIASTFVVNSATQITATVPSSATTGKISATTPNGLASSIGIFT